MITKKCKNCGKEFEFYKFDNRKFCSRKCYLEDHSIDKKKCIYCEEEFKPKQPNRKFCSKDCFYKWNVGKNNGHFKEKIEVKCGICGKLFEISPSVKKQGRKFCSRECYLKDHESELVSIKCGYCEKYFEVPYMEKYRKFCTHKCSEKFHSGENSPTWKPKHKINCKQCGKEFKIVNWEKERGRKFCSRKCFHNWHSGKNHPNWKGGSSFEPYSSEFNDELKEKIRKRDNYICQLCGMTEEEYLIILGEKLSIHHIDYNKENNKEENLISLCKQCHGRTNYNRDYWQEYFKQCYVRNNR